ncbi:MAG: tRNA-(ms[2]io[6]A)-hydroxylase [Proteobacteria bacterium]|nr:tRNA-(ms[2]io[6]A)-hydroxylase [Pseudomonadota bacterium]
MTTHSLDEIQSFLTCETPDAWVQWALEHPDIMLIDHAHCEKKAAASALGLIYRYVDRDELLQKMSRLAREELRHFERVLSILKKRKIPYQHLTPGRYADALRQPVRTHEPVKLVDTLIVGAIIEARSCERFAKLLPHLDSELRDFYEDLLISESRHYRDYLVLANQYAPEPIEERVQFFLELERDLIVSTDTLFRFHSGVPEPC